MSPQVTPPRLHPGQDTKVPMAPKKQKFPPRGGEKGIKPIKLESRY